MYFEGPKTAEQFPNDNKRVTKRGPHTARGKAAVRLNAVRHGLRSDAPVLPGESFTDWQRHLEGIIERLQPEGHLEEVLAERVASLLWRLRRAHRFEVAVVGEFQAQAEEDLKVAAAYGQGTLAKGIMPDIPVAQVKDLEARRILPPDESFIKIMRYEAHLHRLYIQTLHELEALQSRRRGERSPLARLDISGPPSM